MSKKIDMVARIIAVLKKYESSEPAVVLPFLPLKNICTKVYGHTNEFYEQEVWCALWKLREHKIVEFQVIGDLICWRLKI